MLEGLDLLNKLSSLSCLNFNVWGSSLKPKYVKQLEDLITELEILQEMVKMQSVNLVSELSVFTMATERKVSEVVSNQRVLDSRVADLEKAVFGNERNNHQQVDLPVISILRGALRRAASGQYQEVPVSGGQYQNETNEIQEKKGADELEQLLAKEQKLWDREKLQLDLELTNAIEVKNNGVQWFEKKLEHMKEIATMERKKTERIISYAEEKKRENEKLYTKIAELEKQLQAKHAVDEDMEVKKINSLSDFPSALIVKEQSYIDELQESRKVLINVSKSAEGMSVRSGFHSYKW